MPRYAITYHICQRCVEANKDDDQTYHQVWTKVTNTLKQFGFEESGNRTVYFDCEDNADPVAAAKQAAAAIAKFNTDCEYIKHLYLVDLSDDFNLLKDHCEKCQHCD